MDLDELKTEIAMMLDAIDEDAADAQEVYANLHTRLNEMRAMSLPVPDDLARLERQLEAEFCAQSQGR